MVATLRIILFVLGVVVAAQFLRAIEEFASGQTAAVTSELESTSGPLESVSQVVTAGYISPMATMIEAGMVGEVLGTHTTTATWAAEPVSQSIRHLSIEGGRAATIEAAFRNIGTATWKNSGTNFIALNVTSPTGRHSPFQHAFWREYPYRPARLLESTVRPGEIGHVRFAVQAPKMSGLFREEYGLVAEHAAWLEGGDLSLTIEVRGEAPDYDAKLVDQSQAELTLAPGETATVWAEWRNTGRLPWLASGANFIALNVTDPAGRTSAFRTSDWPLTYRPTRLAGQSVLPGSAGRFTFTIKAPDQVGDYTETYQLVAENKAWLPRGRVSFSFQVRDEAQVSSDGPVAFRVGLFTTDRLMKLQVDGLSDLLTISGSLIHGGIPAGTIVSVRDNGNGTTATVPGTTKRVSEGVRLVPRLASSLITIRNYEHRPAWNLALNDNVYRGVIELRHSPTTDKTWMINELPLEQYLKGVAESSNGLPPEFLKTMAVAERTYALYHYQRNTKHDEEFFHVDATYDQVYRGYNFELRSPTVSAAVTATAGHIVTYDDDLAITPYFSNADGRTRAWEEVWNGGPYPWLVSVPDPDTTGMRLNGHGVGMSAAGALARARRGIGHADILTYYYRGIKIADRY